MDQDGRPSSREPPTGRGTERAGEPGSIEAQTRIVLRPVASGMPLGFFAFGTGTLVAAALAFGWIPPADASVAATVMLGFVAPLELLACVFAFLARDTGGATAMGIFSASWVVTALELTLVGGRTPSRTLAFFSIMFGLAVLALAAASLKGKPILAVLLALAFLRSVEEIVVQFGGPAGWRIVLGITSVALSAFSLYGGLAFLLEDVQQQTILPLFRRGTARRALEGDLREQLARVGREAGVRQQL